VSGDVVGERISPVVSKACLSKLTGLVGRRRLHRWRELLWPFSAACEALKSVAMSASLDQVKSILLLVVPSTVTLEEFQRPKLECHF